MTKPKKPKLLNITNVKSIFYGETVESWESKDSANSIDWTIADIAALAKRHNLGGNLNHSDSLKRAWDCMDYTNQLAAVKQLVKIRAANMAMKIIKDYINLLCASDIHILIAPNKMYKNEYFKQVIDICNRIECLGTAYPLTEIYFLINKESVNH